MSNSPPMEELYLGCECLDLGHVAHFMHFPPTKEDKKKVESGKFPLPEEDDDLNIIYFSVSVRNYFDVIIPPITGIFEIYDWRQFFYHNWCKRLWVAGKYIANPYHQPEGGVLDCFDFQNKDLDKTDAFLSLISSDIDDNNSSPLEGVWLDDDEWLVRIEVTRLEFKKHDWVGPWQVGWAVHFKSRGFFGRIRYAFKYIFGQHSSEKSFTIHEEDAAKIRGKIKWVQETNKKDEQNGK
jgi:hypothetical protein